MGGRNRPLGLTANGGIFRANQEVFTKDTLGYGKIIKKNSRVHSGIGVFSALAKFHIKPLASCFVDFVRNRKAPTTTHNQLHTLRILRRTQRTTAGEFQARKALTTTPLTAYHFSVFPSSLPYKSLLRINKYVSPNQVVVYPITRINTSKSNSLGTESP